jgi:hypothetical protein
MLVAYVTPWLTRQYGTGSAEFARTATRNPDGSFTVTKAGQ